MGEITCLCGGKLNEPKGSCLNCGADEIQRQMLINEDQNEETQDHES